MGIRTTLALSLAASLFLLSCPSSPAQRGKTAVAAKVPVDSALAEQGRRLFNLKACNLCHSLDGSPGTGPTLAGIGLTGDRSTLKDWTIDPERIYRREGRRPLHRGFAPMPAQSVSPAEADALAEYLMSLTPPSAR